ncbi:MAG: sensor histidine kinase [bacterium]
MKLNSIRFKISVLYVAILGAILIVYSTFLYFTLHYTLYNELDDELILKAKEITQTIDFYLEYLDDTQDALHIAVRKIIQFEDEHPDSYNYEIKELDKVRQFENKWLQQVDKYDLKEDFINFLDPNFMSIVHSDNFNEKLLNVFIKNLKRDSKKNPAFININLKNNRIRAILIPFFYKDQQYFLQIGTSVKPIIQILTNRLIYIIITIPVILLFASFLGRLITSRILKPVFEITKTAENITHENLSERVESKHIDLEMRYLVSAFNDMIERLEKSFKYISEFSSHVAHELKTPLAIIKGESELTLRKDREAEDYKRALKINLEETERMLKVVNDLLLLTRLDYRDDVFKFEQIDFIDFLNEIHEQSQILASEKEIKINIHIANEKIYVNGDKLHLRRLFFNILDNAIKFTQKKGRIDMSIFIENKKVIVSISDTGIGIPEEDLPQIFNRFFRGDMEENGTNSGSGLGLSIASSIAKIHKGNICVQSKPGEGATFSISLPIL